MVAMASGESKGTTRQTGDLAGCMWLLLQQIASGDPVTPYAQAQARIAVEPFLTEIFTVDGMMSLDEGERIVREVRSKSSG